MNEESKPPDKNKPTSTSLIFLYSTDSISSSSNFSLASLYVISEFILILKGSQYLTELLLPSAENKIYSPGLTFEIFLLPVLLPGTHKCLIYDK